MLKQLRACQKEIHQCGEANKMTFHPTKEHLLILDPQHPYGEHFEILGVQLDTKLIMFNEVNRIVSEASKRLHIVLKLRRYYNVPMMTI